MPQKGLLQGKALKASTELHMHGRSAWVASYRQRISALLRSVTIYLPFTVALPSAFRKVKLTINMLIGRQALIVKEPFVGAIKYGYIQHVNGLLIAVTSEQIDAFGSVHLIDDEGTGSLWGVVNKHGRRSPSGALHPLLRFVYIRICIFFSVPPLVQLSLPMSDLLSVQNWDATVAQGVFCPTPPSPIDRVRAPASLLQFI
jgi:hypothetical protein